MNLGKKEGIVVVGEIQKREIMPLTLELIGAAGKLSKERNLSLSVILSGCGIKEEAKKLYNYGVDEILCIEDEKLIEGHMQLHHDAVIEVLKEKDPKVILIGGTASGRVLAGKTAYAFDTELVCDASKLTYDEKQEQLIITRPAFDGKNMADFVIDPSLASVITIRTGVMGKAEYKEDVICISRMSEGRTTRSDLSRSGRKKWKRSSSGYSKDHSFRWPWDERRRRICAS